MDGIYALLTITIPIVVNWQTDGLSSIAHAAYRVDRKGAGNDFEIDPDPEHDFEIFNWQLSSGSIQSVSYS